MKQTILFLSLLFGLSATLAGPLAAQTFEVDSLTNSDTLYTEWVQIAYADTTFESTWAVVGAASCVVELQMRMNTSYSGIVRKDSITTTTGYAKADTSTFRNSLIALFFPTTSIPAIDFLARIDSYWYYRYRIRTLASGNAGTLFIDP